MVHPGAQTWTFTPFLIVLSGIVSLILLALALRAWTRTRDRALLFVAAAFAVFGGKNFVLGYAMYQALLSPAVVGIADTIADLVTVLLFVVPILLPRR